MRKDHFFFVGNKKRMGIFFFGFANIGTDMNKVAFFHFGNIKKSVHLHPAVLQLIYQCKTAEGINIISDSGHAAGLNVSQFEVDGMMRYVKDGVVRLANGTIAGSAKTVLNGVQNLIRSGIPMGEVAKMASFNPAKTLKIDSITGSIAEGKRADLVVLDEQLNVKYTFVGGQCVYKAE